MKRHESTIQNTGTQGLYNIAKFISSMNSNLYTDTIRMKSIVNRMLLSSGRHTNIFTFSLREMILHMVGNRSLFTLDNLLLNPKDPFADLIEFEYYSDVNSGTWFKEAKSTECSFQTHILMPFFSLMT